MVIGENREKCKWVRQKSKKLDRFRRNLMSKLELVKVVQMEICTIE